MSSNDGTSNIPPPGSSENNFSAVLFEQQNLHEEEGSSAKNGGSQKVDARGDPTTVKKTNSESSGEEHGTTPDDNENTVFSEGAGAEQVPTSAHLSPSSQTHPPTDDVSMAAGDRHEHQQQQQTTSHQGAAEQRPSELVVRQQSNEQIGTVPTPQQHQHLLHQHHQQPSALSNGSMLELRQVSTGSTHQFYPSQHLQQHQQQFQRTPSSSFDPSSQHQPPSQPSQQQLSLVSSSHMINNGSFGGPSSTPSSTLLPTHGRVPPPAPPLVAEPARKEHGDDGTTFIDEVATLEEPLMRARYRKRAIAALVFGTFMALMGSELIDVRNEGNPGACCLPAGCDVMKLHRHWDGANHTSRMCNFTESAWRVMGCWPEVKETANCTMSEPRLDEDGRSTDVDPCFQNEVVQKMFVTGIQTCVAGGVCIIGGFFSLCAFDCFGGVHQKASTRHWIARIVAFLLWFIAFGSSVSGIALGSIAAKGVGKVPFQTRSSCDDAEERGGEYCKKDRGVFWEGDTCDFVQQPGEVFSWFEPTVTQRIFVGFSIGFCCLFAGYTVMAIARFIFERRKKSAELEKKREKEKRVAQIQLADEANKKHNPMLPPPAPGATATSSASSSFHPSMTTQGGSLHQHLAPRQSYRQQHQQHSNSSSANSREMNRIPPQSAGSNQSMMLTPSNSDNVAHHPSSSMSPQEFSAFGAPPPPPAAVGNGGGAEGGGSGYAPHQYQYGGGGGGGGSSQHTPPPSGTFEAPLVAGSVVAKQDPLAEPAEGMPVPQ